MSIGSARFYWLVCDRCGVSSTDDQEITAWDSISSADSHARDQGWQVEHGGGRQQICLDCTAKAEDEE